MSRWVESYSSHNCFDLLRQIYEELNQDEFREGDSDESLDEKSRLIKVLKYFSETMDQVDPELFPQNLFNGFNSHFKSCLSEILGFVSSRNVTHLVTANNHLDEVIILISQSPFNLSGQQKGALTKAAKSHSSALKEIVSDIKSYSQEQLEEISEKSEEQDEKIQKMKEQINELEVSLKNVNQTIQSQTAEFNTQFQNSEQSRSQKFDKIMDDSSRKIDENFKELSTRSSATLDILLKFKDDAEKVLGVVLNTAQAGAYSTYASDEGSRANILRRSAITLFIIGVVVLIAPELSKLFSVEQYEFKFIWRDMLGRIFVSAIIFIPGFYLARESGRHRNNEVINKRRELILCTIDPYLALLPQERAEEIKIEVAKSIFNDSNLNLDLPKTVDLSMFSNILELARNFKK